MLNKSNLLKSLALFPAMLLALLVSAQPALAHKVSKAVAAPQLIEMNIVSVTKSDAQAKVSKSGERLVPVMIRMKMNLRGEGRVDKLIAELRTVNTDGSRSKVSKIMDESNLVMRGDVIMLPMAPGVFAKDFDLKIIAEATMMVNGAKRKVQEMVSKRGSFPQANQQTSAAIEKKAAQEVRR